MGEEVRWPSVDRLHRAFVLDAAAAAAAAEKEDTRSRRVHAGDCGFHPSTTTTASSSSVPASMCRHLPSQSRIST